MPRNSKIAKPFAGLLVIAFFWLSSANSRHQINYYPDNQCSKNHGDCRRALSESYEAMIPPVSLALAYTPIAVYPSTVTIADQSIVDCVFELEPLELALLTIDLRFISDYEGLFEYDRDWEIQFFINDTIDVNSTNLEPVALPQNFLDLTNKTIVHEFSIFARAKIQFRVTCVIKTSTFFFLSLMFINTTSVEKIYPYREGVSATGEHLSFAAVVFSSTEVALPLNLPLLSGSDQVYAPYTFDFLDSSTENLEKNTLVQGDNYYNPASSYWTGSRDSVIMPYLPFFSNCQGYGSHIPIFSLFEQNPNCTLYSVEDTKPINQFSFGSSPVADTCTNIEIQCIYDESLLSQQGNKKWFQLTEGDIFYITPTAMTVDDMNLNIARDDQSFARVTVETASSETDQFPTQVDIDFQYYQVTQTEKTFIIGVVSFSQYVAPTEAQLVGNESFPYTLTISLTPMSHTELVSLFAFDWEVYFVLYSGVGVLGILVMIGFFLYHWMFSRAKKKMTFKFLGYLRVCLLPALSGVGLALIPNTIILFFVGVLTTGKFYTLNFNSCNGIDSTCAQSVFDYYTLTASNIEDTTSTEFASLRAGRFGFGFLAPGLVFLAWGAQLLVPYHKKRELVHKYESYPNRNIWYAVSWKRSSVIIFNISIVIVMVTLVYFSFSTWYAQNIWYALACWKVIVIFLEYVASKIFEDKNLTNTMTHNGKFMQAIITFGAAGFEEFLVAFFILLVFQMMERTYVSNLQDVFFKKAEEIYQKLEKFLRKALGDEHDPHEAEEGEGILQEENQELQDSNIILTDQSAATSFASSDESFDGPIKREKTFFAVSQTPAQNNNDGNYGNDGDDNDSDDGFEIHLRRKLRDQEKARRLTNANEDSLQVIENMTVNAEVVEKFVFFAADTQTMLCSPFFLFITWLYYDECMLGAEYNIRSRDYIYYFMFSIAIIPFQVAIDYLGCKVCMYFDDLQIYDYVSEKQEKFKNRKTRWKGDDNDFNEYLDPRYWTIDQMGFSSQYYFSHVIFSSGVIFAMLSVLIMVLNTYDVFADGANKCIFVTFLFIGLATKSLINWSFKKRGIWNIKNTKKTKKTTSSESAKAAKAAQQQERSESKKSETGKAGTNLVVPTFGADSERNLLSNRGQSLFETPLQGGSDLKEVSSPSSLLLKSSRIPKMPPPIENWDLLKDTIKNQEILNSVKETLINKKLDSEVFQKEFLDVNLIWLRNNLHQVLSPLTLKNRRPEVLNSFKDIRGNLENHLSEQNNKGEDQNRIESVTKFKKARVPGYLLELVQGWRTMAARRLHVRQKVSGLLDLLGKKACQFCGSNWNLRAEPIDSYEMVFGEYLKKYPSESWDDFSEIEWQLFFQKKAKIRTACLECNQMILENHRAQAKINVQKRMLYTEAELRLPLPEIQLKIPNLPMIKVTQVKDNPTQVKDNPAPESSSSEPEFELTKKETTESLKKILLSWLQKIRDLKALDENIASNRREALTKKNRKPEAVNSNFIHYYSESDGLYITVFPLKSNGVEKQKK